MSLDSSSRKASSFAEDGQIGRELDAFHGYDGFLFFEPISQVIILMQIYIGWVVLIDSSGEIEVV